MTRSCFQSSLFAKWIFFTTFAPMTAIALDFALLLQLHKENKRSMGNIYGSPVKYFLEQSCEYESSEMSILSPLGKGCGPSFEQT